MFRRHARIEIPHGIPHTAPVAETLHLVCPHCTALNRIPSARLTEAPKCGQCHRPLFEGHPTELGSGNFRKFIERNDVPVVVDFWAPWCGPCQMMAPEYSAAAAELEPRVRLAKLNTDAEPGLAGEFGIRGIPTMICFRAGREVARRSGAIGRSEIVRWALAQV
jgi:thioredoxin 2